MPKSYPDIGTFTSGQILTAATMNDVATNLDNFRVPPMCSVYRSAALSHTSNGAFQSIAFDTEDYDTDGMWTSGANADRITFDTSGIYLCEGAVAFSGNASNSRAIRIVDSAAATIIAYASEPGPTAADGGALVCMRVWEFTAGDYIKLEAFQNSGGNLAYSVGTPAYVHLTATYLGQKA